MADYVAALGKMAAEKASGAAQGFVRGAKGAFLSETPGLTSAAGFVSTMKKYADDKQTNVIAKEQRTTNVINLEMVRQLRAINSNITNQTRLAASAERRAINSAAFAEEAEREKVVRDDKLLKAIQKIGSANDSTYGKRGGFLDAAKDSLLEKFGVTAAGSAVGTAAAGLIGRLAPALGRVLLNPYVLGALAVALGGYILSKSIKQDSKGKVGFGDGGAMDEAINTGGMTPPAGSGGGGSSTGGGSGGGGGGGNAPTNAGTQASASTLKWNAPLNGLFRITSPYGEKRSTGIHKGVDLAPADRTVALRVIAAADGKISDIGSRGAYGNFVVIKHSDGYSSLYAHLANLSFAKGLYKGLGVKAGTELGLIGNTGRSTAPHLHFEIRNNGNHVDPGTIIPSLNSSRNNTKEATATGKSGDYSSGAKSPGAQGSQDATGPTGKGGPAPNSASTDSAYLSGYVSFEERQKNAIGSITPISSGTSTQNLSGYVSFEEREKRDKQLLQSIVNTATNTKNINKGIQSQNETLKQSTRAVAGGGRLSTGDKVSKYYSSQIESLSRQFQNTTRSLINTSLTSVLFPGKMYGVNRRDAEQPGYLGKILSKEFELQKKMTPFFNKLVGKRFGGQYASMFGQAGGLLLDKGANAIGSMLGFNEQSPFGFGQIVGNLLAKGKKGKEQRKLGREQLIYSMLGIPTGATSGLTFLQKMMPGIFGKGAGGYMTPQQQITGLTDATMRMLGIGPGTFGGALGGVMGMIPGPAASLQKLTTYDGRPVTKLVANEMEIQNAAYTEQTNTLSNMFASVGEGLGNVFGLVGKGLGTIFGDGFSGMFKILGEDGLSGILIKGFNYVFDIFGKLFNGGGGGGGGMFGGGGFFSDLGKAWSGDMSWGDAIFNTALKTAGNIGTMYLASKITSGIDNPILRIGATLGTNYLLKTGAQLAGSSLGFGDMTTKLFGGDTSLTTALKTGDFSSLNPFSGAGSSAGYNLPGEAGLRTGVDLTMPGGSGISTTPNMDIAGPSTPITDFGGMDISASMSDVLGSASSTALQATTGTDAFAFADANAAVQGGSFLDSLPGVGDVLPYAGAILSALKGDFKGAAIAAGATYLGNMAGAALSNALGIAIPGIGFVIGLAVSKLMGGSKPDPRCSWGIYVNGNSDPSTGGVIDTGKKTPQEMIDATQKVGIILFASVKRAQVELGNKSLAYDYFTIQLFGKGNQVFVYVGNGEIKKHGDKQIFDGPLDKLTESSVLDGMVSALLEAMLEAEAAKQKVAAKTAVTKITKPELLTGKVQGTSKEVKDMSGKSFRSEAARIASMIRDETLFMPGSGEDAGYDAATGMKLVYDAVSGTFKAVTPESGILGYDAYGKPITQRYLDNEIINDAVTGVLNNSALTTVQKATLIRDAASENNVSASRIAEATGYDVNAVNAALSIATPAEPSRADIIRSAVSGLVNNTSLSAVEKATMLSDAAAKYGVSAAEISSATGYGIDTVNSVLSMALNNAQSQNTDLKTASSSSGTNSAVLNSGNQVNANVDNSTTIVNESTSNRTYYGTRTSEFEFGVA